MFSDLVRADDRSGERRGPRPARPAILIDTDPSADILVDARGRPVWPIRDEADRSAVARLCELRSIGLRDVTGRPGRTGPAAGAVVGVGGAEVQDAARLYAHLTGRGFRKASGPSEASGVAAPAVVVTTFEHLTSDLLFALYSDSRSPSAPGLICASAGEDLRRQVLVRSILLRASAARQPAPWSAIFPTEDFGTHDRGPLRAFGAQSSPWDVREALAGPSDLLTITTHCDGVDAFLGRSLTLCAVTAETALTADGRSPACWISGHCHRHRVSIPEFLQKGVAVTPGDICAGILLLDTCFGTLAADAPVEAGRGLGARFVENLGIGALATTWELTVLDPGKLSGLVADLARGMTLGRAVARFNRSEAARRTAARLAIFGDPRARLAGRAPALAPAPATRSPRQAAQRSKAAGSAELGELGFSRACLEHGIAGLSAQLASSKPRSADRIRRQLDVAETALRRLRSHELAQWTGTSRAPDPAAAEQLRQALIQDAYLRRPMDDWKEFAEKTDWADCRCGACGAPARVGVLALRVPGVSRRRVVLCPRCGVAEDMPEHVRMSLRFANDGGACALVGGLPERDWSGALILRTRDEALDRIWPWPAEHDGRPSAGMPLPEPLPHGPLKLAVIMVHGGWTAWTAVDIHTAV